MTGDALPRAIAALARVKDGTLSDADLLDACRVLEATMATLAGSPDLSADERAFAQHWVGEVQAHFRDGLPEVMRTLAALTLAAEDAAIRREASELLESAAQKLRAMGRNLTDPVQAAD